MSERTIEIIESKDGSHTLFLPHLNETYHSLHGAIIESEYVFIKMGLEQIAESREEIHILEVGFGTGLNALLTYIFSMSFGKKIFYHTLEPFPIPAEVYEKLNYIEIIGKEELKSSFLKMHEAEAGIEMQVSNEFSFVRYQSTLENFSPTSLKVDLIYYDAFAPSKQPEVWSLDNLNKIKGLMNENGILVTYCASGQFKRDLKEIGFSVEVLQGPPGKKQMTRAKC
jgi:tRNA U34 5-methylaminomethyl-2-thiouridine-forming methyltransferase MnmC